MGQAEALIDTGKDADVISIHSRRVKDPIRARPISVADGPAKKIHPYYDYGPICSYNAFFYLIVGGRGLGKTYGAKRRAFNRYLTHGEQFIYVRRHKEDLTFVRDTFFTDIQHEFPDWDFRSNGIRFEISPASERDARTRKWETMGYLVALSVAQKLKSVSFAKVTTIIYDEFIIEKGHVTYLPNEAKVFLDFYSTVDRNQDKTRVFLLANAVSIGNPYFAAWDIYPNPDNEYVKIDIPSRKNYIVAHFPKAEDFAASVMQTHFGQFIAGTEYAEYAVGNIFSDNGNDLVKDKDPNAKYRFTIDTKQGAFSIWHNIRTGEYYASSFEVGNEKRYTTQTSRVTENVSLMYFTDMPIQLLRAAQRKGRVYFNTASTRNAFAEFLDKK